MNKMRKIFLFLKNIFIKQNEVKILEEPKIMVTKGKKESFVETLKITNKEKITKKKVETLTCNGDGLGIQKKLSY